MNKEATFFDYWLMGILVIILSPIIFSALLIFYLPVWLAKLIDKRFNQTKDNQIN